MPQNRAAWSDKWVVKGSGAAGKGTGRAVPRHPRRRLQIVEGDKQAVVLGSDYKGGPKPPRCRLCRVVTSDIRMSHVVPKWAYRQVPEDNISVLSVAHKQVRATHQDGTKHYMLCNGCEQYLGDAENYLAVLSRGQVAEMAARGVTLDVGPTLLGVDYTLVLRGLLGIAFKVHDSPARPFTPVNLRKPVLERIRKSILADDYSSPGLGVAAMRWMDYDTTGINPRAVLFSDFRARQPAPVLDLTMGGISWWILFSAAPQMASVLRREEIADITAIMLHRDGTWYIPMADIRLHRYIALTEEMMGTVPDIVGAHLGPDSPCPCGLPTTFGACCLPTWQAARDAAWPSPHGQPGYRVSD